MRYTEEEAIREAALSERRTLSGFILNATLNRIANQERIETAGQEARGTRRKRLADKESR